MLPTIDTTSISNRRRLGNTAGFSPFSEMYTPYALRVKSDSSSPAWNTRLNTRPSCQRTSWSRAASIAPSSSPASMPCCGIGFHAIVICQSPSRGARSVITASAVARISGQLETIGKYCPCFHSSCRSP